MDIRIDEKRVTWMPVEILTPGRYRAYKFEKPYNLFLHRADLVTQTIATTDLTIAATISDTLKAL